MLPVVLRRIVFIFCLSQTFHIVLSSSLLCGRTKEVQVGVGMSSGTALALALVQPSSATANKTCQLKLTAPEAAAFNVRLIDVKESMMDTQKGLSSLQSLTPDDEDERKWSVRSAPPQQDTEEPANSLANNNTDACKLFIYLGESNKNLIWKLSLCGANSATIASRAGIKLLPPKIRIVWHPPTTPHHHTDKLRLVVTAVNSGMACKSDSQFPCGVTDLCVSSYLVCDGILHCPGGEDEDPSACQLRPHPPILDVLRRFAARNQEFLGIDPVDRVTESSVIMKINETESKPYSLSEFVANIKANGPMSYFVCGMVICAVLLTFCIAYEYCPNGCKLSAVHVYAQHENSMANSNPCVDSPTVSVTASSQNFDAITSQPAPPAYDPPPSYSSLFPVPYKSSPTPQPHCSHQEPPD